MEKNGISKAKKAKNIGAKRAKKEAKRQKKIEKKAEKMERKDIRAAYETALKKQGTEKMLAVIMIVLTISPIAVDMVIEQLDKNKEAK